ncbi:MAG: endonuclease III domain-containing protein [Desulfobulbaceae bacterium]|nr:MAG: endonuclease III domain-containing protein [Desulfobulbaceae bacterium]
MSFHPLREVYEKLMIFFGSQNWWPGETPLEITVGAVLTQNTAWVNVERAINNLKTAGLLPSPATVANPDQRTGDQGPQTEIRSQESKDRAHSSSLDPRSSVFGPRFPDEQSCLIALAALPRASLAAYLRPVGYYNVKAQRLHNLIHHVHYEYGNLADFLALPASKLRRELLGIKGIGPETADSIMLYAAGLAIFVVDGYTHRIFSRHQLLPEDTDYHSIQAIFTDALPADPQLYNEYHALIVKTGKEFCRKIKPRCSDCPLRDLLR